MKKITRMEYQKDNKDRVNIYLDEEFAFAVDINILIKYGLVKNMELNEEFISDILSDEDISKAYNYAISVLSRNSKSEKQLRFKMLQKGYREELVDSTLEKLKLNKYIDDNDYSERFVNDKINFSKCGKRRIGEALHLKGIDRKIIDEKLKGISDESEFQRAYELAEKKLRSLMKEEPLKRKVKLSNFLINKGFDYDIVKKAVSRLMKYDNYGYDD